MNPEKVFQAVRYLALPFQYPHRFSYLSSLILSNRTLARELVQLTPHSDWFRGVGFKTVIDIGAFVGAFSQAVRTMLPEAMIYAFEPLELNYPKLIKNFSDDIRFKPFKTALGEYQGEVDFWKSDFAPSSSVLPMAEAHKQAFPHTSRATRVSVPINRLDDFMTEMELEGPVLLKLDVQGYEIEVLKGAEETLKEVDFILTEVSFQPLYENQTSFDDLYQWMDEKGFQYMGSFEALLSPIDRSILQNDLLFSRVTR